MKQIIIFAAFVALAYSFAAEAQAQSYFRKVLINNKTYANSQTDSAITYGTFTGSGLNASTFPGSFNPSAFNQVTLNIVTDTSNVKMYFETRTPGIVAWTLRDSISLSGNGPQYGELVLKGPNKDNFPGLVVQGRIRPVFAGSSNAVSKRYSVWLNYAH